MGEEAYERQTRRGFPTLEAMRRFWRENRRELLESEEATTGWWAYVRWG
jgi:hypothetical protein